MIDNEYAGFRIRVVAFLIDMIIYFIVIFLILFAISKTVYWDTGKLYWDNRNEFSIFLDHVLPPVAVVSFWIYKSATPGKMVARLRIVDAQSGNQPTVGQYVVRYLGYFASSILLFLGFIWISFDKRKQGWHDKLAGTVVIRSNKKKSVPLETRERWQYKLVGTEVIRGNKKKPEQFENRRRS